MSAPTPRPAVPEALRPAVDLGDAVSLAARHPNLSEVDTRLSARRYLSAMWSHREFALTVPLGQLRARNQDTTLGRAWYLINPLLLISIYYLIFEVMLDIESRGDVEDYLPFLTVGVIAYGYTRGSVQAGAESIVRNRRLVGSLSFPRAILPLGALIGQTSAYLYALAAMSIAVLFMGQHPGWGWLLLPVALVVHGVMNLGLALFAARFNFHFRDFGNFLPYILRLGLYVSGIILPINANLVEHDLLRWLLQANPLYNVVEMTRQTVLGDPFIARHWWLGAGWALTLVLVGFAYFRRAEARYSGV